MKLKMYFLLLALGALGLQSCDNDDDDDLSYVPAELKNAFTAKYPTVSNEKWETKGNYYVADFRHQNYETSAWFTSDGTWQMTETDIPYQALPSAVKSAFESSEYAKWKIDDVDMLERLDMETVYVIEVESGKQEFDLYYSAEGILIKSVADTDNDSGNYLPAEVPAAIENFIKEKYPNARLAEIEVEHGMTEVDIIHNNISKEVVFNSSNQWAYTSWDVHRNALPVEVTSAIASSPQYAGYHVDEADFFETPTGEYYLVELEKGELEVKVKITTKGEFIP
ncbi:PepSY-like domain-containing protein [Bacteroides sp.]|jgi:hypothetical protein|uniref:PepSY-like domain-containing protein n=1 Tax=Bacteroides sp. TaxID=29523 RepID=UPI002A8090ED|nr:PepSY-like domain-containing protein [Bacteroides sp.]